MNGIHSELNGGGENMALKDEVCICLNCILSVRRKCLLGNSIFFVLKTTDFQSPQVSSTSSSSSEADDEEADGESSGEPPGTRKEEINLGKRTLRKDETKVDSPPPSYPSQQVEVV